MTVFASTSFLRFWLSPRLHRFDALHPSADLHLVSSNKCNRFDPDECDAAIVYSDTDTHGFSFNAFSMMNREYIVPVASPSYLESRRSGHDGLDFSRDTLLCLDNADEVRVDWDFWFEVTNARGARGGSGSISTTMSWHCPRPLMDAGSPWDITRFSAPPWIPAVLSKSARDPWKRREPIVSWSATSRFAAMRRRWMHFAIGSRAKQRAPNTCPDPLA